MRSKLRALEALAHLDDRETERRAWRSLLDDLALFEPEIAAWLATPEGQAQRRAADGGLVGGA